MLEGDDITLSAASRTDATGATGGGTVLVGGDWQGGGAVRQAIAVTLNAGASIDASATQQGDGGKVVLWSDVTNAASVTTAQGSISATGGALSGDGGQIETSGHRVAIEGVRIDAGASSGTSGASGANSAGGQWLIDPYNYTIGSSQASTIVGALNSGTSVTVDTSANVSGQGSSGSNGDAGSIHVNADISKTAGGNATLTLKAHQDIRIAGSNAVSITSTSNKLNLVLWADQDASGGGSVYFGNPGNAWANTLNTNGGQLWAGGSSSNGGSSTWNGLAVGNGYASSAQTGTLSWFGVQLNRVAISTGGGNVQLKGKGIRAVENQQQYGVFMDNSSINTAAGSIDIDGQTVYQASAIPADNVGVKFIASSLSSTTGAVHVAGITNGFSARAAGIDLTNSSISTTAGNLTLAGSTDADNGINGKYGVSLHASGANSSTTLSTDSGALTLNGSTSVTNNGSSAGVRLSTYQPNNQNSTNPVVKVVSKTGNIVIAGDNASNGSASATNLAVWFDGSYWGKNYIGFDGTNAYSGDISVQGRSIGTSGFAGGYLLMQGSGSLTLEPKAGGNTFSKAFTLDSGYSLGTGHSSLTLGGTSNTAAITVSNAQTVAGPISIYGGAIALNSNLTSTNTGDINIVSSGSNDINLNANILKTGGDTSMLTVKAGRRIVGSGYSVTATNTALNTVLWANNVTAGMGVHLGTITTNGGHLWVGGGSGAGTTWNGLTVGGAAAFGNGGSNWNAIDMYGPISTASSTSGGDVYIWGSTAQGLSLQGYNGAPSINAGNGNVTLRANTVSWATPFNVTSTGTFNFWSGTGTLTTDTGSLGQATDLNYFKFNSTPSALTWGGVNNTQSVTFTETYNPTLTIAGPINIYGGNIALNNNLTSTAAGAGILAKASGIITTGSALQTAGGSVQLLAAGSITDSAATSITSGSVGVAGGNVLLAADTDSMGGGRIAFTGNLNILSYGGNITLAGGDAAGSGYALGTASGTAEGIRFDAGVILDATGNATDTGGDITLRGKGWAGVVPDGYGAWGVGWWTSSSALINAGTGKVAITGIAQQTNSGGTSKGYGISLRGTGTQITSAYAGADAITLTGDSSAAKSGYAEGILIGTTTSTEIVATGVGGGVTLTATGGPNTPETLWVDNSPTYVLANGGPINVTALGGDSSAKLTIPSGKLVLGSTLASNTTFDVTSSTSNVTLDVGSRGLSWGSGSKFEVNTTGSATFLQSVADWKNSWFTFGNTLSGLTVGDASGNVGTVTIDQAQTVNGPVTLYGKTIAINANLTSTAAGAGILAKASGDITQAANVALNTQGGNVSLLANSDGNTVNYGAISLNTGTSINSRGGNVLLGGGVGGTGSATVRVTGLGNGGSETAGETQAGVALFNAQIDAGSGAVTLRGRAVGTPDDFSHGVSIRGDAGTSSIVGAAITIEGESDTAANVGGNGSSNRGISIINSSVAGSADVRLTGIGSAGTGGSGNNNRGVFLSAATVTSGAAAVQLSGTGRSVGGNNGGVLITGNSLVRGTTATTVTGSGSATGFGNGTGVAITGATTRVASSANGAIDISGSKGGGASVGVELSSGATLGSAGSASAITVSADELSTSSAFNIHTTGVLTVQPLSSNFAAPLAWPLANMAYLATPGGLTLGKVGNTADITVSSAQTIAGSISIYGGNIALNAGLTATGTNTILLQGSGTVTDGASGFVVADKLLLSGGNVTLDSASNNIGTLAASGVGSLTYVDSNALTLGTVGATNGINATGLVNIGTNTLALTVAQNVSTTNTTASALVMNAGISTAAGTSTGGNILISGSPTVSVGSGGTAKLFSGSISGSTGLTTLVGSGSGRFRYYSDETATNYSTALATGLNAIYRERPSASIAVDSQTLTYGDALTLTGTTSSLVNGDAPVYSITSALYSTSNNLRASATPYAVTSALAGLGYNITANTPGTLTVNAKALSISGVTAAATKVYDGAATANITNAGSLSGLVSGDVVTVSNTGATYDTKDVGTGKTVTLNGLALASTDAGNYSIATSATTTADITAKALTATATAANKVYDGSISAAPVLSITAGLIGSETVTASGTGSFNSEDVLTATTVTVASTSLANGSNGGLASNYSLTAGQTAAANITAKALTATTSASDKVYDGSNSAAPVLSITAGLIGNETVTASGTGSFNSKDVLTATTVTVASTSLANGSSGGLASNYSLTTGQTAAANITAKALTATASAPDKAYDGSNSAAPVLSITAGLIGSETVTASGTGNFNSKDVLTATTVTVASTSLANGSNGGLASNYSLVAGQTGAATITPAILTATVVASDKVYDGNTLAATVLTVASGLVGAETLGVDANAAFNTKDVLTAHTVTVVTALLSDGANGGLAGNYLLAGGQTSAASITPAMLTALASAPDKTYDDNTSAAPVMSITNGLAGSETLVVGASGSFNSKDVLTAHTVTVEAVTLMDGGLGGLASNYRLASGQTASAAITPRALTVSGISASDKMYDGGTGVAMHVDQVVKGGLLTGDQVDVIATGVFTDKNAGAAKSVQLVSHLVGGDAANYAQVPQVGTVADISPAPLTVRANDDARFVTRADDAGYRGVRLNGLVAGETSADLGGTLAITRTNAGMELAGHYDDVLTPSGLQSTNYTISFANGSYTIVPANQLLVTIGNLETAYGVTPVYASVSAAYLDGANVIQTLAPPVRVGDRYSFADGAGGAAVFDLAPIGAATSGAGHVVAGSYTLGARNITETSVNFSNNLTVLGNLTVSPKQLSTTAPVVHKVYDGTTALTGLAIGMIGNEAGDGVAVLGDAVLASRNVGNNLSYRVDNIGLAGVDSVNYVLTAAAPQLGNDAVIAPRVLVVSFDGVNKVYDGQLHADANPNDDRVAGDAIDLQFDARFIDKNVGTSKTVQVTVIGATGADAANYSLTASGTTTADITRLDTVSWTGGGGNNNWFDPANWAGGAVPDLANVARVVIPAGVEVEFGGVVVAPAQSGAVVLDSLGDGGDLRMIGGSLQVGLGGLALSGLTVAGGALEILGDADLTQLTQSAGQLSVVGALDVDHYSRTGGQFDGVIGGQAVADAQRVRDTIGWIQRLASVANQGQNSLAVSVGLGGPRVAAGLDSAAGGDSNSDSEDDGDNAAGAARPGTPLLPLRVLRGGILLPAGLSP